MGFTIVLNNGLPEMTFAQDPTLATDLLLSAMVPRGSFFFDPAFGLRELPKIITENNVGLVRDYYAESCKFLIDSGRAKSIEVTAEPDDDNADRINVQEKAVQANDTPASFETFVGVV